MRCWSDVPSLSAMCRAFKGMGIKEVLSAPQSPWQNPYSERLNGSIRRECLDRVIVFGEDHLKRVLKSYFEYYNQYRTHLSLDMDSPTGRPVQPPEQGKVISIPQVGGLHHSYERRVAQPQSGAHHRFIRGQCPTCFTTCRVFIVLTETKSKVDYSPLTRVK